MQKLLIAIIVVAGLVLTVEMGAGQSVNGTIRGVVRDASKHVIPGVKVELTNVETKATFKTVASEAGEYKFEVPPGVYALTAFLMGFKELNVPDVRLNPNETIQKEL